MLRLRTNAYRGDLLVHNNEICRPNAAAAGGIYARSTCATRATGASSPWARET